MKKLIAVTGLVLILGLSAPVFASTPDTSGWIACKVIHEALDAPELGDRTTFCSDRRVIIYDDSEKTYVISTPAPKPE